MSTTIKNHPIANGYRLSQDYNVFPPITERPVKQEEGSKQPLDSTLKAIENWSKVKEFVSKNNSIPKNNPDDENENLLHEFLTKNASGYHRARHTFITQDGVCKWNPVKNGSTIIGWINSYTNQVVYGDIHPGDSTYTCVKSAAEIATNLKPLSQVCKKKTTENKPGMNK